MEVFKLTWIDLQKLIWMNFKATFLTLPVKMHTFFRILIFFSVLSCLSWLTNWVFSITAEKVTQNWSLSLLISQPLLFNKYFYCKTGIYPPDRVSDNSEPVKAAWVSKADWQYWIQWKKFWAQAKTCSCAMHQFVLDYYLFRLWTRLIGLQWWY